MDRRALLRAIAGGAVAAVAGCGGDGGDGGENDGGAPEQPADDFSTPSPSPTPAGIVVPRIDWAEGEDGQFVVVLELANNSVDERTQEVTVTLTVDGDESVRSREVTLAGGASDTRRFGFERSHDVVVNSDFGIEVDVAS